MDGEGTLSNFNEPFNFEVKQEKMENEENKNTEQPESFPELDDSNLSPGGEKVDAVVVEEAEKLPAVADGGEESLTDKNDVGELEVDATEELDKGAGEESGFEGVGIAEEAVAEDTQVLESEVGGNKSGSDSGDPLLASKGEEELVSEVAGDGSEIDSGTWDLRPHFELEMDVTRDVPVAREEMELSDAKAVTDMEDRGYEQHIEKEEGADIESERTPFPENDSKTIVEAGIGSEEKVTENLYGSKVEITEELVGNIEEKCDSKTQIEVMNISEGDHVQDSDGGMGNLNTDVKVTDNLYGSEAEITEKLVENIEENCDSKTQIEVMNFSEGEHVHDIDGGMGNLNTDVKGKSAADRIVSGENLMEDKKDMSMEVGKGLELDELSNAVEMKEVEAVSREEISAEDTKMETQVCMEVEVTRDHMVQEIQVLDSQTETEVVERNDFSETIPSNDTERETDETKNGVEETCLTLDDSQVASEEDEAMPMEDAEQETDDTKNDVEEPGLTLDDSQAATEEDEATAMEDAERETKETKNDVEEPGLTLDDSLAASEEDEAMAIEGAETQDTEVETETDVAEPVQLSGEKRKRERNTKGSSGYKATAKTPGRKKAGEDVCFICFDGGDLVLCDRRGCPKAYHPSCVNRDEAFFNTKGRWNCGWHMCSICEKNAHYMCYTCTYSSCKGCIKDEAVIFCVRGNKGFCETCMRTVMLIENNQQENAQLDFDDKTSWESLFKDYYLDLKSKLSLSSAEIAEAKHPWKGSKQESPEAGDDADYDGGSGSDDSIESQKTSKSKRRKLKKRSKSASKEEGSISLPVSAGKENISSSEDSEWATKELLEFVSHMRNGDVSELSQFDVQALLLEYIKRNKLRDPRRKSQIICDFRLGNLFGKPRVGHFEMLKLLESHFPVKKDKADEIQGSVVGTESNQLEVGGDADTLGRGVKGRKSKTRKKSERRGPQSNLEDYAAIDAHNIGLIYLRRKLMEDLLEDVERFHEKVVGAFVRIRISGSNQKQDLYRLVQVIGTSKAAEPYKISKKSCDTMLEILNLDKAEIISIDTISNQEFTEEECKRLRQSIKCGLINRLTVGDILDKTMELQAARVNDWLESEVMRLSHLRDRASDLGRRKELRECVEKLQLLKTPEERHRRLEEIPEIHADSKMDPSFESEEDENEADNSQRDSFTRSRASSFSKGGRGLVSPRGDYNKDTWNGSENAPSKNWESSRNLLSKSTYTDGAHYGEMVNENSYNHGRDRDVQESKSVERTMNYFSKSESVSIASPITSTASFSDGVPETVVKINETEKIWHYKDPLGKVQGPFSMAQLQKWNNTGYFPADMRIWRTSLEDHLILLSDALLGKYLPAVDKRFPAVNATHTPGISSSYPGKITGSPLHQDIQRPITDQGLRSHPKHSTENWVVNDLANLPSPTPKQKNAGWMGEDEGLFHGATQHPSSNGLLHSPTPALPNARTHSSPLTSVLNSAAQSGGAFTLPSGAGSLQMQSNVTSEPHNIQLHGHLPSVVQSAHPVISTNNPSVETHGWGGGLQSGQGQAQGWGGTTLDVQSSSGHFSNSGIQLATQPDVWRPSTQCTLPNPNVMPPSTQNVPWGTRPENPNIGWGNVQSNPNMGWGTPTPGNTNINVGLAVQPGNTSSWVAPSGNPGTTVQGPPGNVNSGWVATPGWGGPVNGPAPGNGWGPPSGNPGGLAQANPNQGFGAPAGAHGTWGGRQNHNGGQFTGQGEMRDPGFGGGRTSWNGGASRPFNKRGMVCPYNANGRCKKGARCDYLHT